MATATLWALPCATSVTPVGPLNTVGISTLDVVPFPTCPDVFVPQPSSVPFGLRAPLWFVPPVGPSGHQPCVIVVCPPQSFGVTGVTLAQTACALPTGA